MAWKPTKIKVVQNIQGVSSVPLSRPRAATHNRAGLLSSRVRSALSIISYLFSKNQSIFFLVISVITKVCEFNNFVSQGDNYARLGIC